MNLPMRPITWHEIGKIQALYGTPIDVPIGFRKARRYAKGYRKGLALRANVELTTRLLAIEAGRVVGAPRLAEFQAERNER